jgi:HD-like signal output (HDOD) protein
MSPLLKAASPFDHNLAPQERRDAILRKIASDPDLPALGSAVSQVVQLASSGEEAVRELAHFVLSDPALTQKILRLSNTVAYRNASGNPVTTISRAIFLLGFDAVKTGALAMLLVEGMSGAHAQDVRAELSQALCASVVGRELARRSSFKDSEEAAIAALFKNMGQLLVAAHDHPTYRDITALMHRDNLSAARASAQTLGCSFESLAEPVLRDWAIPDSIINAMTPLPAGPLRAARNRQEWMQQVAAFSTAAAGAIAASDSATHEAANRALLSRFGPALGLDQTAMTELFAKVAEQAQVLTTSSNLYCAEEAVIDVEVDDSEPAPLATEPIGLPSDILMAEPPAPERRDGCHPSGKPYNARDLLLAGVQDVSEMMASGRCKVSELALLVLETLSHSLGFRFATICVRDIKTGQYRARVALGEEHIARQAQCIFSADGERDLFSLALKNDADLLISDATAANIFTLIPQWHRNLLPDARSFIVLPLVVQGKPFGVLYGDRIALAPEGVPAEETALIKTLKGQMIAALTAR